MLESSTHISINMHHMINPAHQVCKYVIHIYFIIKEHGKGRNPFGYFMSHNVTSCEMKQN